MESARLPDRFTWGVHDLNIVIRQTAHALAIQNDGERPGFRYNDAVLWPLDGGSRHRTRREGVLNGGVQVRESKIGDLLTITCGLLTKALVLAPKMRQAARADHKGRCKRAASQCSPDSVRSGRIRRRNDFHSCSTNRGDIGPCSSGLPPTNSRISSSRSRHSARCPHDNCQADAALISHQAELLANRGLDASAVKNFAFTFRCGHGLGAHRLDDEEPILVPGEVWLIRLLPVPNHDR